MFARWPALLSQPLTTAGGVSLPFEKKELTDPNNAAVLKLNKQGTLRFRMLKKAGDKWEATGDLRALATIQVK